MKAIKLTPLMIFILLLVVLLLSIFISSYMQSWSTEGFLAYNYNNGSTAMKQFTLPFYSNKTVYQLYDSLYFDSANGNVIELFGTPYSSSADTTGSTITNMVLMPKTGTTVYQYNATAGSTFSNNMVESNLVAANNQSSYMSWYHPNADTLASLDYEYQVLYSPWGKDTVITVVDLGKNTTIGVYTYINGNVGESQLSTAISLPSSFVVDNNSSNNSYVNSLPGGGNPIQPLKTQSQSQIQPQNAYQVCSNIFYDAGNGNIYLNLGGGFNTMPDLAFNQSSRNTIMVTDHVGENILVAVPFSNNRTLLMVISCDPGDSSVMQIRSVVRFDPSLSGGIDTGNNTAATNTPSVTTAPASCVMPTTPAATTTPAPTVNMNDYFLKSSIVPPICPACPSCPSIPSIPACPSLLKDVSANTLSKFIGEAISSGQWSGYRGGGGGGYGNSLGGVSNNLLNTTGNVVTGAENTIGQLGTAIVTGAAGLGQSIVGGVKELGHDASQLGQSAVGGVKELGKDVTVMSGQAIGGVNQLGKTAVGGVKDIAGDATKLGSQALGSATLLGAGAIGTVNNTVDKVTSIGQGGQGGTAGPDGTGAAAPAPVSLTLPTPAAAVTTAITPSLTPMVVTVTAAPADLDDEECENDYSFYDQNLPAGQNDNSYYVPRPPATAPKVQDMRPRYENFANRKESFASQTMHLGPGLNNYFGAIPSRGTSNFAPVTTDLTAFGK